MLLIDDCIVSLIDSLHARDSHRVNHSILDPFAYNVSFLISVCVAKVVWPLGLKEMLTHELLNKLKSVNKVSLVCPT